MERNRPRLVLPQSRGPRLTGSSHLRAGQSTGRGPDMGEGCPQEGVPELSLDKQGKSISKDKEV